MRATTIVVALFLLAGCSSSTASVPVGPRTVVFADEAVCADLSESTQCTFIMCDLIPEDKTFEESCGPYFQEGVTAPDLDGADIDRMLIVMVPECAFAGDVDGRLLVIDLPTGGWLSLSGPSSWLASIHDTTGTDCEA